MLHAGKFLKSKGRNGNQQIVYVGFVRHTFKTLILSKSHCMKILFEIQSVKHQWLMKVLQLKGLFWEKSLKVCFVYIYTITV